jgi:ABC-type lipoprotein release transport system permease subunit
MADPQSPPAGSSNLFHYLVFVAASLLLTLAALSARWIPARRATKVDSMAPLRSE